MWAYHGKQKQETVRLAETVQLRILAFREAKLRGRVPRVRARSKQVKDEVHKDLHAERRLFQEGYRDQLESLGEVDALTSSEILDIHPAEVLTDPKLRYYEHPQLKKWFSPMSLDEQIVLMGGRALSGRPEDAVSCE